MSQRPILPHSLGLAIFLATLCAAFPAGSQTPKRGGILNTLVIEDPPGLLIHESATVSNVWPMSPCYSNLVLFHPLKQLESAETVIPEYCSEVVDKLIDLHSQELDPAKATRSRAGSSSPTTCS